VARLFKQDTSRTNDIYLIASSGDDKQARKVTFDSYDERSPRFAPDGRKLFFIRSMQLEAAVEVSAMRRYRFTQSGSSVSNAIPMIRKIKPCRQRRRWGEGAGAPRRPVNRPPHETKVDWAGLKHRTRQITRMPFPISNYIVAPDSRTIVFVTSEPAASLQLQSSIRSRKMANV